MGFFTWLKSLFGSEPVPLSGEDMQIYSDEYASVMGEVFIREMAFWSAANLISNAVSKCEFKTFIKGKEEKKKEYYLWNVEPNKNQNSSNFMHKLIGQLCQYNECLIVENGGQLLIADSFTKTEYAMSDDVFSQVQVGNFSFTKSFNQSEVLYFKLSYCNMRKVINALYESYSKLINYSMTTFQKSRGTKGVFNYETIPIAGSAEREAFDSLVNEKISKWLTSDNSALPLGRGQEWKELEGKTYASETTRDIRAQVDDISDFTAKAFGIPPALLRGDVQGTSEALEQFLTFCVDPLADMLQEEINRKRSGYLGFIAGTYVKIDTKSIKHVDLLSVATSIDKLIGSGAFCVNDIKKLVGEPAIDEEWANKHFITKNYTPFEEALNNLEGGEV